MLLGGQSAIPIKAMELPLLTAVCKSINSIMMGLRKVRKKIRKFQDGEQVRFFQNTRTTTQQLEKNNHNSSLYSHVLVFEQRNEFGIQLREHFFANKVKIQQFNRSNLSIQLFQKIQHLSKVINTLIFISVKQQSY